MGKVISKLTMKTTLQTDKRVKLMNEIISGMRVIKMYCWEKPFSTMVETVRKHETKIIRLLQYNRMISVTLLFSSSKIIMFLFILPLALLGEFPSRSTIFVVMGLINGVRVCFYLCLPSCFMSMGEIRVTIKRIQKFLLLEELTSDSKFYRKSKLRPEPQSCEVKMENATAKWDEEVQGLTLDSISLSAAPGQLVAVIGPVGSGKSSLFSSILGELPLISGSVELQGQVAYAAQQPWVFSATLRQNVCFGQEYEYRRYKRVLRACALEQDLEELPNGDQTLVGERGVCLSGGQKARLSLARAVYRSSDVYLLDDPLSAVDSHVGKHLYDKCIRGLLRRKTVILVTHQLQYLKDADNIIVLQNGRMIASGTFSQLARTGFDFTSLMQTDEEEEKKRVDVNLSLTERSDSLFGGGAALSSEADHLCDQQSFHGSLPSLCSVESDMHEEEPSQQEEEKRVEGAVASRVYIDYIRAGTGYALFLLLSVINISAYVFFMLSDWWPGYWSRLEEENRFVQGEIDSITSDTNLFGNITVGANQSFANLTNSNSTLPTLIDISLARNLGIFFAFVCGTFLCALGRNLLFTQILIAASRRLHNNMFENIVRAPILFFDTNPVGRILNRFSKDIGQVDNQLIPTMIDFNQVSLWILSSIVLAGVLNPWVFIAVVPLGIIFLILRWYYLRTSREVKRLEGTTRSPVFSHLSATLQGLHTLRAYQCQDSFIQDFDQHQDVHTAACFHFIVGSRWFGMRLDLLCSIFAIVVCFSGIAVSNQVNAEFLGLSVVNAIAMVSLFQWAVRESTEVDNQMTSVERVLEYARIPRETELEDHELPPDDWPEHGDITASAVYFRYSKDRPNVLRNLNFCIHSREKIGVVGRTGAGKSSLIAMLFRLAEPSGSLVIDGKDCSKLSLHQLRSKISIIPQDPVLFSGTVRYNLDPFHSHEDSALWTALAEVQLGSVVNDLPGGLDCDVAEGGSNLSIGQRQLMCLARALLRHNKILIIDEATANVDHQTDEIIQRTIRTKFAECTVLTIAHRLNTIMDSDRIMVMSDGEVVEMDSPHELLQRPDSVLTHLVEQTGDNEEQTLREQAAQAFNSRLNSDTAPNVSVTSGTVPDMPATLNTTSEVPVAGNTIPPPNDLPQIFIDEHSLNPEEKNGSSDEFIGIETEADACSSDMSVDVDVTAHLLNC